MNPTERSISPQMSRKTSPSAMMTYGAESCVNRIGRFVPVTNARTSTREIDEERDRDDEDRSFSLPQEDARPRFSRLRRPDRSGRRAPRWRSGARRAPLLGCVTHENSPSFSVCRAFSADTLSWVWPERTPVDSPRPRMDGGERSGAGRGHRSVDRARGPLDVLLRGRAALVPAVRDVGLHVGLRDHRQAGVSVGRCEDAAGEVVKVEVEARAGIPAGTGPGRW